MAGDLISAEEAERRVEAALRDVRVVAIDGLPLAGKSTLAHRLARRFGLALLTIDDFYDGPRHGPGYPFPYFRYDEFEAAVTAFRQAGRFELRKWDWPKMEIRPTRTVTAPPGPLIVEGCSVLQPRFAPLYDLTLFVESDLASAKDAQRRRDGEGAMSATWEEVVWPSVDLYLATEPWAAADLVVAGRGCTAEAQRS